MSTASRDLEMSLATRWGIVAGMDEVGRGALAGPVAVGVALIGADAPPVPAGLTDSKALTPRRRDALVEPIQSWVQDCAVGYASPQEIDRWGIIVALRLAGRRALAEVASRGLVPGGVLLDGSHDWLSEPDDLFGVIDGPEDPFGVALPVHMQVKADLSCAVVAAASVLAKVARDRLMAETEDPGYGWASNKGYGSAAHARAIAELGVSDFHRRSWKMPTKPTKCGAPGWQGAPCGLPRHDGVRERRNRRL